MNNDEDERIKEHVVEKLGQWVPKPKPYFSIKAGALTVLKL